MAALVHAPRPLKQSLQITCIWWESADRIEQCPGEQGLRSYADPSGAFLPCSMGWQRRPVGKVFHPGEHALVRPLCEPCSRCMGRPACRHAECTPGTWKVTAWDSLPLPPASETGRLASPLGEPGGRPCSCPLLGGLLPRGLLLRGRDSPRCTAADHSGRLPGHMLAALPTRCPPAAPAPQARDAPPPAA